MIFSRLLDEDTYLKIKDSIKSAYPNAKIDFEP